MKSFKEEVRKKWERARQKNQPKIGDSFTSLTSDRSQRIDFATLGERNPVDKTENEQSQSQVTIRKGSGGDPPRNARPERLRQKNPTTTEP